MSGISSLWRSPRVMKNVQLVVGTVLMLATISSLTFRPVLASSGTLTVNHSTVSPGTTVVITQTEKHPGTVKSFIVTKPNGQVCIANGGSISKDSPLSRTFPTDFKPIEFGQGTCDSNLAGTYDVQTRVVFQTNSPPHNNNDDDKNEKSSDPDEAIDNNGDNECSGDDNSDDDHQDSSGECIVLHHASFETYFFVLPETPLGAAGIIGASLAALGSFLYLKKAF
jgi:hypothetical protein